MKLIKPGFEILEQKNILEHMELCGRVAYKSEDKITEGSAKKFIDMIIKRGHTAVLEHGTVYLLLKDISNEAYKNLDYVENKYSVVRQASMPRHIDGTQVWDFAVTTNYRVLQENGWLSDLQYQCEPTEHHEKRISVKFTCDRGVSHEFVRHRVFSFVQESTRFCNYSKNKFDNELTFIKPIYLNKLASSSQEHNPNTGYSDMFTIEDYKDMLTEIEAGYHAAIVAGLAPQEARMILPNSLKTELIMTGTVSQWKQFFILRTANDAHPQAKELAIPLMDSITKHIK